LGQKSDISPIQSKSAATMKRQEMIEIAHKGLLIGRSPLLRLNAAARSAEVEGVVMRCWGPVGPALNKVAVVGPAPPLQRILELANAFFGSDSVGFGIVVEADAGHPLETELRAAGWRVFEDEPALVLPSIPAPPPLPPGLEVKRICDVAGRRDLLHVLAAGFGEPTAEGGTELDFEAFDAFAPSLSASLDPDVALLVGYCEGKPAASAFFFKVGSIAGITGVATVPAFRRRRLGTALTWEALRAGAARGCTCATLAALGASFDLYRKMGFIHVCNHRAYEPPKGQ
jgi:ribosomal protein S18 acetylase RimI-like enzyme